MPSLLLDWLEELRRAPLAITGDLARKNVRWFGAGGGERAALRAEEVVSFLHSAAEIWDRSISGCDEWLFYAWYDEMAGQLRIAACPARTLADLPFGCALRSVEADDVARAFLLGSDTIPWREMASAPVTADEADLPEPEVPFVLGVWTRPLSGSSG